MRPAALFSFFALSNNLVSRVFSDVGTFGGPLADKCSLKSGRYTKNNREFTNNGNLDGYPAKRAFRSIHDTQYIVIQNVVF